MANLLITAAEEPDHRRRSCRRCRYPAAAGRRKLSGEGFNVDIQRMRKDLPEGMDKVINLGQRSCKSLLNEPTSSDKVT